MALTKQILGFNLSAGVDTKTDPKSVVAGKLLTLENGTFVSPKRIKKRNGYSAFPTVTVSQAQAVGPGHVLDANAISLWRFSETSGLIAHDIGSNAFDLTASVTPPAITSGLIDNARRYVRASQTKMGIVTTSTGFGTLVHGGPYTVETWVNPTSYSGSVHSTFFGIGNTNTMLRVYLNTTGTIGYGWYNGGDIFHDSGVTMPLNVWTHVAIRINNTGGGTQSADLFVNGVLVDSLGATAIPVAEAIPGVVFGAGGESGVINYFDGYIDDTRLSNIARTAAEIAASAANTASPTTVTPTGGQGLTAFDNELVMADKTSLYSWDASGSAWFSKGSFVSATVTQSPVIRNSYQQTGQDSTTHPSGLQAFAWEDSSGGSRYSVIDTTTGQTVVSNTLILSTAIKPKLLSIGNQILLLYVNTVDFKIYGSVIPLSNPTAVLSPVAITGSGTVATALNTSAPNYDAAVITTPSGPTPYVAFNNNASPNQGTTIFSFTAATPTTVATNVVAASEVSTALTIFGDLKQQGPVLAYWNGTAVKFRAYDSTLATVVGSGTLETVGNVVSLTGVSTSTSGTSFKIFYSVTGSQTYNYVTRQCPIGAGYAISAPSVFMRSAALFGKAFLYGTTGYVPLVYESPLQPTYFVADHNGSLVAKLLYANAGKIPSRVGNGSVMLAEVNAITGGTAFQFAALQRTDLTVQSGAVFTQTGVASATVNFFDQQNSYLRAQLGNNLHFSGGFPVMYDGISPVEHGFHLYPEPVTAAVGDAGSAFTYSYAVCFEWQDNKGQIHRSAPSITVIQTKLNAITGANPVTVTIPTLRLTAKQGTRTPVLCVVYRTTNNGTTLFQTSSVMNPLVNDPTVDTVTFSDTTTDAALIGNPVCYTQPLGSSAPVIENIAPGPVSSMCVHQNRIFALDPTSPLQINYSKQVVPGAPVEFSAGTFTINVDPRGGACTAIASMDDKLIVFKASSIFFHTGQGPDSTGGQNDFSDSIFVTSDVGCTNPRSLVFTSSGLMFQSGKGIYLLNRSLQLSYVGFDVEAYNSATVTSAQQVPSANEVRFTLSTGVTLVYNDLVGQWAVFTPIAAVDSTVWQGTFCYLTSAGAVYAETPGVYADAGNYIKLRLVTSWLQFAGVQGFQRVYKALILGEYASPHSLLVQVAYDFNGSPVQADTITPTAPTTYGSDATYGSGTPYGGAYAGYQWRVFFQQQKCEAIQLSIEDVSTGTPGEGFSISALTFEVGTKRGAFKLPSSNSYG